MQWTFQCLLYMNFYNYRDGFNNFIDIIFFQVTICSVAFAQLNYDNPSYLPEYEQTQSSYSVALTQEQPNEQVDEAFLSTQFQPPRPDAPKPFFIVEPSEELRPPNKEAVPFSYDPSSYPPVPSEELQLPNVEKWNPNNDPNLYYTPETPTKLYPKKYNKDLNKITLKTKPLLTDEELAEKQKFVEKVLLQLEKQENRKRLEQERKQAEESQESYEKVPQQKHSNHKYPNHKYTEISEPSKKSTKSKLSKSNHQPTYSESSESRHSETSRPTEQSRLTESSSHSEPVASESFSSPNALHHGLSHDGDRMEFQVHGHDGPKTYKWGYDTGKG